MTASESNHAPQASPASRRHIAFTLTELLVVIVVIAILGAMLLPVLSKARESSKTTRCLNNLRQIGLGMGMYINESADRVPTALNYDVDPGDTDGATFSSNNTIEVGGVVSLFQVGSNISALWCPSDIIDAPTNSARVTNTNLTSYNYRYVVWYDSVLFPDLKLTDFVRPTAQVIYHEAADFHFSKSMQRHSAIQPTLNAVYADLHARPWNVLSLQPPPANYYDPAWFYIINGTNNPRGHALGTVENAWDIP